jgi:hypothetical protein
MKGFKKKVQRISSEPKAQEAAAAAAAAGERRIWSPV